VGFGKDKNVLKFKNGGIIQFVKDNDHKTFSTTDPNTIEFMDSHIKEERVEDICKYGIKIYNLDYDGFTYSFIPHPQLTGTQTRQIKR
jgi:hypothetical protein